MFDDYAFKNTSRRIQLGFIQKRDEPMYPWEIAAFLNRFNTVYYKYELLNSICSAINNGISPSDIFIFDKSLPLYRRYAAMNLLTEGNAAKHFYSIGLPYPLMPNTDVYCNNLLYQAFGTVNSYLYRHHIQPLRTESIVGTFEILNKHGLSAAEEHIVSLSMEQSKNSVESARKRHIEKKGVTEEDVWKSLERYEKRKAQWLTDLNFVEQLDDEQRKKIVTNSSLQSRRASALLLAFFRHFEKTTRPLVCARVGDGQLRVLGRSLINKREQTGLELREATRNSPLQVIIEGGIAAVQAIRRDAREKELHELELKAKELEIKKKELEVQQEQEKLHRERMMNDALQLRLAQQLNEFTQGTDIGAFDRLPNSFMKERIAKAYSIERRNTGALLYKQDLDLDDSSIKLIDTKA